MRAYFHTKRRRQQHISDGSHKNNLQRERRRHRIASVSVLVEYQTYFPLDDFVRANRKKVGTLPTCSRRIFSLPNFNRHVIEFFFRSRRANKVAKWKIDFKVGLH